MVTEFTEKDVKNTWEMRKLLEPYAAKLTAKLQIDSEIEELEKRVQNILSGDYDLHFYIQTDSAMHELLFIHIDNDLLKDTIEQILHRSVRMRYFAESKKDDHRQVVDEVCREHLEILGGLRSGNPDFTEEAVRRHIEHSERRTLKSTHYAVSAHHG